MLALPEETFASDCPYHVRYHYDILGVMRHALVVNYIGSMAGFTLAVDPAVMTRRALYNFVEDIREYGRGELATANNSTISYDEDDPGVILVTFTAGHHARRSHMSFCKSFLDALEALAG